MCVQQYEYNLDIYICDKSVCKIITTNNYKYVMPGEILDNLRCIICDQLVIKILKNINRSTKCSVLYCKNITNSECQFLEYQTCNIQKNDTKRTRGSRSNIN